MLHKRLEKSKCADRQGLSHVASFKGGVQVALTLVEELTPHATSCRPGTCGIDTHSKGSLAQPYPFG